MSVTIELAAAVSISCTILGAFIGITGYRRNSRKDIADDAKSDGVVLTEIGYIKSGIDDIKRKQLNQDDLYTKMAIDVAEIRASTKQAHKRLDRMEGKQYE